MKFYTAEQKTTRLSSSPQDGPFRNNTARQQAMGALALADIPTLEAAVEKISRPLHYIFLREPEVGLVMLEGRVGNTGRRFNLGEMLVTRCVLRLDVCDAYDAGESCNVCGTRRVHDFGNLCSPHGDCHALPTEGYAFIQGNSPRHAELAALFDALLQQEQWADTVEQILIRPLLARRQEKLARIKEETATTKVDFFTMVRGENE